MESLASSIYVTFSETPIPSFDPEQSSTRSLFAFSIPSNSKRRGHYKSLSRLKPIEMPISEQEEVEKLNLWPSTKTESARPEVASGFEKVQFYRGRFSDLDRIVSRHKTHSLLPPLTSKSPEPVKILANVAFKRAQKLASETDLREKTKYSKVYEDEMATSYVNLQSTLEDLFNDREDLRSTNTDLHAKLQAEQLLLRQESALPQVPKELKKAILSQTIRPRETRKNQTPRVRSMNEVEFRGMEAEKDRILREIEDNARKARDIDGQVKRIKTQMKEVRDSQVRHYLNILKEGTDTRSEGLSWVLKSLWALGQKTPPELFPPFVDLQTIDIICQIAVKTKEADLLAQTTAVQHNRHRRMSITARAHPDKWNGVQDRLKVLGKKIVVKGETGREDDNDAVRKGEMLTEMARKVREGQDREMELRVQIAAIQDAEMKRLIHECCFNKLEQQLGVSLKQMLSALLGIEVINRQMSSIAKEQKCLVEELEKTKTYWFGGGRK